MKWRSLLGVVTAPFIGHAVVWSAYFLTLGWYRRFLRADEDSAGIPGDVALVYFVCVPILAAGISGAFAALVSRSRGIAVGGSTALAIGASVALLNPRWWNRPAFWCFCVLLAVATILGYYMVPNRAGKTSV